MARFWFFEMGAFKVWSSKFEHCAVCAIMIAINEVDIDLSKFETQYCTLAFLTRITDHSSTVSDVALTML